MTPRNFIGFLVAALVVPYSGSALAQVPPSANAADRNHAFVRHVEAVYAQSLKAEKDGDVGLFKTTRTRTMVERTMENLKRIGKSESDLGALLKSSAEQQTDISKFRFIRVDAKPGAARLLYQREGKDEKGPTLEFAAIMAHWDDGAWRIGWVGNAYGPRTFMGKERTIDEFAGDPRFGL